MRFIANSVEPLTLIVGPAGSGKSRLLAEISQSRFSLSGLCSDGPPFAGVRGIVSQLSFHNLYSSYRPYLRSLLLEEPPQDPAEFTFRTEKTVNDSLRASVALLRDVVQQDPLLICLDGVEHLDRWSIAWLHQLSMDWPPNLTIMLAGRNLPSGISLPYMKILRLPIMYARDIAKDDTPAHVLDWADRLSAGNGHWLRLCLDHQSCYAQDRTAVLKSVISPLSDDERIQLARRAPWNDEPLTNLSFEILTDKCQRRLWRQAAASSTSPILRARFTARGTGLLKAATTYRWAASQLFSFGYLEEAADCYAIAFETLGQLPVVPLDEYWRICFGYASVRLNQRRGKEAIEVLEEARELTGAPGIQIQSSHAIALAHARFCDPPNLEVGLQEAQRALALIEAHPEAMENPTLERLRVRSAQSYILMRLRRFTDAEQVLMDSLTELNLLDNRAIFETMRVLLGHNLGMLLLSLHRPHEALTVMNTAVRVGKENGIPVGCKNVSETVESAVSDPYSARCPCRYQRWACPLQRLPV